MLLQKRREQQQALQRLAQIMTGRGEELRFGQIGAFGLLLGRTQFAQRLLHPLEVGNVLHQMLFPDNFDIRSERLVSNHPASHGRLQIPIQSRR
jgi:hypothetical protein